MDQELKVYLEERFSDVDARFGSMDARLSDMEARFEQLETAVRHTQVTVEAMRGDIRLIAEGVMGITERQETLEAKTARGFEEVKAMLSPYYKGLDGRAQSLENDVQGLDRRVRILEANAGRQTQDVLEAIRQKFGKPQA
jgi:predicted  nucleic acid-binding Zn-ribbon protein